MIALLLVACTLSDPSPTILEPRPTHEDAGVADPLCDRVQAPGCPETRCTDGIDNDADGLADCLDPQCQGVDGCGEVQCANGRDDDGDGYVDQTDDDCPEQSCDDGSDNDGDGLRDCLDLDCEGTAPCGELICDDGIDGDDDGLADCLDPDCNLAPTCHDLVCDDGIDSDDDGLLDCLDPDCAGDPVCVERNCRDGLDNEGDHLTDCADPDCTGTPACRERACDDGLDDDLDGLVDCEDDECAESPDCVELDCTDGLDSDDDGLTDCSDDDCWGTLACPTQIVASAARMRVVRPENAYIYSMACGPTSTQAAWRTTPVASAYNAYVGTAFDVVGMATGPSGAACAFSVDEVRFGVYPNDQADLVRAADRVGLQWSSMCGTPPPLPAYLGHDARTIGGQRRQLVAVNADCANSGYLPRGCPLAQMPAVYVGSTTTQRHDWSYPRTVGPFPLPYAPWSSSTCWYRGGTAYDTWQGPGSTP